MQSSLSDLSPAVLTNLERNVQVWSRISLHLLCSRATERIADRLVVLLLLIHAKPSDLTETAAAVCVGSGGDSRASDVRVVEKAGDSVAGLLWILLYLCAGLPTAITDGSGMISSMPVITGLKVPHFLNKILVWVTF